MLLIGRKEICNYLRCSWRTVQRKKRDYRLPIRRYPPNIPCLNTEELDAWIKDYDEETSRIT